MISEQAGKALRLIPGINLCKATDHGFWRQLASRIVIELDEAGNEAGVTMIRELLAGLWDQLEDKEPS